ncbi:MAG TPA: FCD domain-containing protein, partial [Gemmatimonadaceae bacterium]|nr:FCD domain-containing protein [Gemmatimonadaceae bacterium]
QGISNDLRAINMKLAAAANARPRDPDLLFELQTAFHMRFAYETSGAHFRSIYDTIRPQVQRYEWIYGTRRDATYEPSTHEHTSIIGAIADGDADLARSALDSHWKRATARTVAVIDALVNESVKEPSRKRPARQKPITRDNRK